MTFFATQELTIHFGGLAALDRVSFEIERGDIYSIIGPNGAGKTTLFNIISGLYRPTNGRIVFKDQQIQGWRPDRIARLGIARTFQNIELFRHMTTMDNLMLGRHGFIRTGLLANAFFFTRRSRAARAEIQNRGKVEEIIDFLDLQHARDHLVMGLPYGVQKTVELGRALAMEPELLLLDEPSAGMNLEEKQDLMIWLKDITEDLGVTVLLIEHDMKLVMDISKKITVLNYGRKIAEGPPELIQGDKEVHAAYLGED